LHGFISTRELYSSENLKVLVCTAEQLKLKWAKHEDEWELPVNYAENVGQLCGSEVTTPSPINSAVPSFDINT